MGYIGIFDSGQGGLTLLEKIIQSYPQLNYLYLGDNARYPYGNKSKDSIRTYTEEGLDYLVRGGAEILMVACGTASTAAVPYFDKYYKGKPIFGIVDCLVERVHHLASQWSSLPITHWGSMPTIAVLATRYSVGSGLFSQSLGPEFQVWERACPLFVSLVEEGLTQGPAVEALCEHYLSPIPKNTHGLLLACTHFPRLILPIARWFHNHTGRIVLEETPGGPPVVLYQGQEPPLWILDSSRLMMEHIKQWISKQDKNQIFQKNQKIFCTDDAHQFEQVAKNFMDYPRMPKITQVKI